MTDEIEILDDDAYYSDADILVADLARSRFEHLRLIGVTLSTVMGERDGRKAEAEQLRADLAAIRQLLDDAEHGDYATSGRDFGRGVAYLARELRQAHPALAAPVDLAVWEPSSNLEPPF